MRLPCAILLGFVVLAGLSGRQHREGAEGRRWFADVLVDPHLQIRIEILPRERLLSERRVTEKRDAYAILLNAVTFAPVPYGYFGTNVSAEALAFDTIRTLPEAKLVFADLVKRGTDAGKMYGLCGLYLTDEVAFEREVAPFLTSKTRVLTALGGCVVQPEPVSELVRSTRPEPVFDIVGGKFPESLRRLRTWDGMETRP